MNKTLFKSNSCFKCVYNTIPENATQFMKQMYQLVVIIL